MNLRLSVLICLIIAFGANLPVFADHLSEKNIRKRTAPIGQVYLEGDEIAGAASATAAGGGARSGEAVYNQFCTVCHGAGVAGAPKLGDKDQWAALVSRGIDDLTASAIKGKNAMPPKGTCMDCSDAEIQASVQHMLDALN